MTRRSWTRHFWTQLPFFAWLVAIWMLLWGQFTWLAFFTGIAVAIFVTAVFRLPAAELTGRVNPLWLLVEVVVFLAELGWGALQVAWLAIAPGTPRTAVVRVPLRVDDDLIMTHAAVALSLVPGSTVIEEDRARRILYLHVIGVRSDRDIERARASGMRWEARIVRAVGSREELALVRSGALPYADRREEGES
ncbi:Na+/H+ antiporter subunit E [Microbacterium sp. ZXX196]|uniref:Na+/H+ antiporter subunit E n=1 Tax=Microbacterium sp. ZXX196 TaxID=2609291 RepID=UPI0012B8E4F8|nr:Na+/H+ antiporter subunit E [Microbacterium sp. ZXX196]MTE24188.1 Na+/H+ antiporter subunit E [Microbacterium sp. ZXX196]